MIDYAVLVQAIDDWRAGQRPESGGYPVAEPSAEPFETVEAMDSGMVVLDNESGTADAGDEETYAPAPAEDPYDEAPAEDPYDEDLVDAGDAATDEDLDDVSGAVEFTDDDIELAD